MLRFFVMGAAAIVGGLLGESFGALAGALTGAALAWLGFTSRQQAVEIAQLRRDLDAL